MESAELGFFGCALLVCGFFGWFIPERLQTWALAVGTVLLVVAAAMHVFEIRTTNRNRGEQ